MSRNRHSLTTTNVMTSFGFILCLFKSGSHIKEGWGGSFYVSVPHFLTNRACFEHRTKCQCLLIFNTSFHLVGDWEPCGHLAEDGCSGEDGEGNGLIKSHSHCVPGWSVLSSTFSSLFHSLFCIAVYIIALHFVSVFGFIFNYVLWLYKSFYLFLKYRKNIILFFISLATFNLQVTYLLHMKFLSLLCFAIHAD